MDRFEQGLPDPQEAKVVGYCDECSGEFYEGQEVLTIGQDRVCNFKCLVSYIGAETITVGGGNND